jgi:PAS domain S-box-containing protein
MDDHSKTKHELIQELVSLRKRIAKQDQYESERKKVKEALHETKERFAAAFHASPNLIAITKMADGTIVDINEGYSKLLGYSGDESIGKTTEKLSIWANPVDRATFVDRLEKFGEVTDFVTTLRRKDGTVVTVLDSARSIELQGEKCLLSVAYDITERKQYEESLHNASLYTRNLIEVSLDPLVTINQEGRIIDVNKATETVTGISRKQLVGSDFTKYFTEPEKAKAGYQQVLSEGLVRDYPLTIRHTSGSTIDVLYNATVYKNEAGQVQGVFAAARDITKRKQAEESLRESEEKYRTILESIKEGYFEVDLTGNFTFFNDSLCRNLGYSKEELIGMNNRQYTDKENAKKLFQAFNKVYKTGEASEGFDWQIIRKDGTKRYVEASVLLQKDSSGKPIGFGGIVRDVTERKEAEEELKEVQLFNTAILDSIPGILYLYDDTGHLVQWNKQNEEVTGYSSEELKGMYVLDWFGGVEPDTSYVINSIADVTKNGHAMVEARIINKSGHAIPMILTGVKLAIAGKDYLLGIGIDITDRKRAEEDLRESEERYRIIAENTADTIAIFDLNLNPTYISPSTLKLRGYTVQEAMTQTLDQMLTPDSLQQASKNFADQMALESSGTADPTRTTLMELEEYCKDGSTIWVELAASFLRDNNLKPTDVLTITRDITERKRSEEQLHQTLNRLKKAVGTTIQVLGTASEVRDPYTAGHQKRVADLARAIATEMGLPQDKIEGIRMAGSIHDIGKLSIPAEILSKPTKLTDIEFSLIKEHSRNGYEMLKDVESPWPLAQIVYQHHERMDGSGYPRNLKGDEILIEARIIAVADVVEAMASHRPYRPGLGIDAALAEIEKNKGIFYDNTVADACLRLFREKGYQFK